MNSCINAAPCRTSTRCGPRCARTTSARCARGSTATRRSRPASSASSPSCAIRSWRSTATTRASRPRWERAAATRSRRRRRAAPAELRRLDHEREITPDWLQREQAVGYVAYADRFAGTLRRRARAAALPARARRQLPAPDAAAARAPGAQRRRLRGGRLRRRRARARHDGRPARARRRTCAPHGMALCVDVVLNHTAREHAWARAALAGDERSSRCYRTFADRAEPDAYEATLPEVFPDIAPGSFTWVDGARALGVDDVQRLPVGPRLHEPRRLPGDGRGDARRSRRRASTCCASTPCRSCGSARARTARTSPRSTSCCRRFRAVMRIAAPGGGLQGGGDRLAARARRATSAPGATRARSATSPTTTCSWCCCWSALASGRVALMTQHAARHAAGAARRGLGDLRALPRRHRLGDHRGGRGRGRARTATCTGASSPTSTPATSPARSRAARASRRTRARARRARAARRRRWPGSRRRSSAATRLAGELAIRRVLLLYASPSPTAACR